MVSAVRYHPYGQERWTSGATPTDFGFTSQRNEASFGLMDYNARYYSPVLGRFISPDSIVPEPTSSGGFNRYRYARNSPLMYTDPTGHCGEGQGSGNLGAEIASTACKQLLKYREDIFFPDENTTTLDRIEASYVMGVLSVAVAALATRGLAPVGGDSSPKQEQSNYTGPEGGWSNLIDDKRPYPGQKAATLRETLDSGDHVGNPDQSVVSDGDGWKLSENTVYQYAIDADGNVRVARRGDSQYPNHSDLVQGENVYGAGEIWFDRDGNVEEINNVSGHYRPNKDQFYPYLKDKLRNEGLDAPSHVFK